MLLRVHSFGVILIRISDPRSVWIMVHQRNRWIHDQSGFTGSFDAPWSRQILDHWSRSRSPQRNADLKDSRLQDREKTHARMWLSLSYQKKFWDFEIGSKASETHVFLLMLIPFHSLWSIGPWKLPAFDASLSMFLIQLFLGWPWFFFPCGPWEGVHSEKWHPIQGENKNQTTANRAQHNTIFIKSVC